MRLFTLLLLFTSISGLTTLKAQESTPPEATQYTVSGQLLDDRGEPIGFANVLLLNATDSVLAKAELSDDDGSFAVSADSGSYMLKAVMLGYVDYLSQPFELTADFEVQPVRLETFSTTLATATVTSKKPFLEQQAGKMVVNVAESLTGQNGSTMELLRKVPGLVVVRDQVSLAGQPNVTILIDNKPTKYMDMQSLLKEMPAADIEKIEVINQPGAAFDAEGAGGVINIVLKKNVKLGTNGSVRAGVGYGEFLKANTGLTLNHRSGPLNTYGSVNLRRGTGYDDMTLLRRIPGELAGPEDDLIFRQHNDDPYEPMSGSVRAGIDYDLTDKSSVGISGSYRSGFQNPLQESRTRIFDFNEVQLGDLYTAIDQDRDWANYGTDVYWRYDIDTSGRKIEFDASYGGFRSTTTNNSKSFLRTGELPEGQILEDIINDQRSETNVFAAELDYHHPLTKKATLHTGIKHTRASADAQLISQTRPAGMEIPYTLDQDVSDQFLYDEDISAAYLSADFAVGEVKANVGLRYEYTWTTGNSITLDSIFKREYDNLFPSVGLSGPIKGSLGWAAAYSYRVQRPNYADLNPFIYYLDPFTFQRGNTGLRPEFTHNTEATLTYDGQPFFKLAYQRTTDVISLVTEQDSLTGFTEAYDLNLDTYSRYGGHLFFPLSFIPKVEGYAGVMAYYNDYKSEYLGGQLDQGRWNVVGFANAQIELPFDVKGEVNFWYVNGGQEGIISYGTLYGSSLGLQRNFMDDQLEVGISLDDPVYRLWSGEIDYQSQQIAINNSWETRIWNLNLTYKFGNRYLKKRQNRESAAGDVLRRVESD